MNSPAGCRERAAERRASAERSRFWLRSAITTLQAYCDGTQPRIYLRSVRMA
jgi:hypothetical protein